MNRIEVKEENVVLNETGNIASTSINNDTLVIDFNGNSDKNIALINNIYKNVIINILDNSIINIFEMKDNNIYNKFDYIYNLGNNSKVTINKFYYIDEYNEDDTINLNGEESDILFNLSAISLNHQIYNISVNHNNKRTVSNINNHGVTLDNGIIDFIVNGTIKKGMSDSITNQDNKIMTLGNGKSMIKPNLFIDENMVEARHGASIGRFNEEEIFYLKSRGIPENVGYQMLMKAFLLNTLKITDEVKSELDNIISMFRR
jgi:Fe-S cluster assembly scaffold protein SufB